MIDDRKLKELNKLHPKRSRPVCCSFKGDVAILHSHCIVLELPKASVKIEETEEEIPNVVELWRNNVPKVTPVAAQAMRDRPWPEEKTEDGEQLEVIRLMGGDADSFMQQGVYEFIQDQLMDVQFQIYPGVREDGAPNPIGIFIGDKLVGLVGAFVDKADPKWLK